MLDCSSPCTGRQSTAGGGGVEKGTFYISDFLGPPSGRSDASRPSRLAVRCCQRLSPYVFCGCDRWLFPGEAIYSLGLVVAEVTGLQCGVIARPLKRARLWADGRRKQCDSSRRGE